MDRTGRCVNFGNCTIANQKQSVTIPRGLDFKCPECGRELVEVRSAKPASVGPWIAVVVVVAVAALLGWWLLRARAPGSATGDQSTTAEGGAAGNVQFRMHGSNTIGESLGPALVEAFLKFQGAQSVRIAREGGDKIKVIADNGAKVIEIEARGSATGFTDLAAGKCEIGMSSRPAKPAESTSAVGDLTSPTSEHIIGLDGVAIIVNRNNPIDTLSRDQLARILSGAISDWSELKGTPGHVNIYARDNKSGTYETVKNLILGSKDLVSTAQRFEDSNALSDRVSQDPGGIGFVGLPYIRSAKALAVSDKGARALTPNRLTVATEDYLISRRLFLYTPANLTNQAANRFIEFAISKEGQDVVEKTGFVAQHVRAEAVGGGGSSPEAPVVMPLDGPPEYKRLTSSAERLSVDYRFRAGATGLDNKALVDLDRLITFLGDLHYTGSDLILMGFADATGAPQANQALSKERADAVAKQIARRGVTPATVVGFGDQLPVADNGTEEGRQKNRRVEVWVKKRKT